MGVKKILKHLIHRIRGSVDTERLIELGLTVGENFQREEDCIIDQSHCWLISIGNNVTLAPRVHILAHDASMHRGTGYTYIAPVNIGNNVFIGAGSIIMPGVKIGDNCVIGAGSTVTRDISAESVAAGNPARVISTYSDFIAKHKLHMNELPVYGEEYTLRNIKLTNEMKNKMKSELEKSGRGYVL